MNPEFERTDVVLIVGANDVVNPAARDPESVIAGMPILDVDYARNVIVMKRSLSPGFAGIDNDLFYMDNTMMFFGDAKAVHVGPGARSPRGVSQSPNTRTLGIAMGAGLVLFAGVLVVLRRRDQSRAVVDLPGREALPSRHALMVGTVPPSW